LVKVTPPQRSLVSCVRTATALGPRVVTVALLLWLVACGSSPPTQPTPQPPTVPANTLVSGTVVDAMTDQPIAGVTIRASGLPDVTTGTGGDFTLTYPGQTQFDSRTTIFSSPSTVERSLTMRFPATGPVRPSLIPKSFDLASFDAMFRSHSGALRRWVVQPTLVVERRVLALTNILDPSFLATSAVMSAAEAQSIADDLSAALPQLSGNTFPAFKEVRIETSDAGAMVSTARQGIIVAARYDLLRSLTNSEGRGVYYYNTSTQDVVQSSIMLDPQFESSASASRVRTNRMHTLGHAMAWSDVETVASVMNGSALNLPTEFDRIGSRLAFLRAPGNTTPDVDPVNAFIKTAGEGRVVAGAAGAGVR
jgi:hypothetical protein